MGGYWVQKKPIQSGRDNSLRKSPSSLASSAREEVNHGAKRTMHQIQDSLSLVPKSERCAMTRKEQKKRDKSRLQDYERKKAHRSARIDCVRTQWEANKGSYSSPQEDDEDSSWWNTCESCGASLCFGNFWGLSDEEKRNRSSTRTTASV